VSRPLKKAGGSSRSDDGPGGRAYSRDDACIAPSANRRAGSRRPRVGHPAEVRHEPRRVLAHGQDAEAPRITGVLVRHRFRPARVRHRAQRERTRTARNDVPRHVQTAIGHLRIRAAPAHIPPRFVDVLRRSLAVPVRIFQHRPRFENNDAGSRAKSTSRRRLAGTERVRILTHRAPACRGPRAPP